MYKIIHELVDLNIHNYLQFSKETRTRNSHAYIFRMPSIASCVQGESDYIFEQQFKLA